MSQEKVKQSLTNLGKALDRLEEALQEDETNALFVDGTIQRFEFVIELFWKLLKRRLALEGVQASTPKQALKEAYQIRWLESETVWLKMLDDRNQTSHIYDEALAREIYERIKVYFPVIKSTYEKLSTL